MATKGRPPKTGTLIKRATVAYRFAPETVKAIKRGARKKKLSQTDYVENAVLDHLRKDGIIKGPE
jgi:hypothetical protein